MKIVTINTVEKQLYSNLALKNLLILYIYSYFDKLIELMLNKLNISILAVSVAPSWVTNKSIIDSILMQ